MPARPALGALCSALALALALVLSASALVPAGATSLGVAAVVLPIPSGGLAGVHFFAGPIDCPSVANCVAEAVDDVATGGEELVIETLAGATWTEGVVALPIPAASISGIFPSGISCSSVGNCVATGSYWTDPSTFTYFAAQEVAGAWGAASTLAVPAGSSAAPQWSLQSAACPRGGTQCYLLGTGTQAATNSSDSWVTTYTLGSAATSAPVVAPRTDRPLLAISCPAASDCTAVGNSTVDGFAGGSWSSPLTPSTPSGDTASSLTTVSCVAVGDCVAAGTFARTLRHAGSASVVLPTAVWTEHAGHWDAGQQVADPGTRDVLGTWDTLANANTHVSCVGSVANCVLASTSPAFSSTGVVAQERGGRWGQFVRGPLAPTRSATGYVYVPSCASTTWCAGTGARYDLGTSDTVAVSWVPSGAPPSAPRSPRVLSVTGDAVRLEWAAPAHAGAVHYLLRAGLLGRAGATAGISTTTTGVATLLDGPGTYRVAVQAIGADGQGSAATAALLVRVASATGHPTISELTALAHGVELRWQSAASAGGQRILRFDVFVTGAHARHVYAVGARARAATLGGLRANTKYAISIAAVSSSGPGAPSSPLTFVTSS